MQLCFFIKHVIHAGFNFSRMNTLHEMQNTSGKCCLRCSGGDGEIRTLARCYPPTAFRVRTLQPLGYISICNFKCLYIIPYSRIGFKSFSARNRIFLFPPPQQTTASLHPSKEKAADKCRPLFKIQNQTRSYSTTPSIMVMSTLTLCSSRVSISRTLQSRMIISASLPTSRLPLMFSS